MIMQDLPGAGIAGEAEQFGEKPPSPEHRIAALAVKGGDDDFTPLSGVIGA
jgi:hypothetical protein